MLDTVKIKWAGVAVTLAGALAAALNLYPLGPALLNLGALLWLVVGLRTKDHAITTVNAAMLVIYTVGLAVKLSA
jgi:apolipoprotein N-acyltransferase